MARARHVEQGLDGELGCLSRQLDLEAQADSQVVAVQAELDHPSGQVVVEAEHQPADDPHAALGRLGGQPSKQAIGGQRGSKRQVHGAGAGLELTSLPHLAVGRIVGIWAEAEGGVVGGGRDRWL